MSESIEVLSFAMLMRALTNGAAAISHLAKRDPGFFERSFASCALVLALWPDEKAESGIGFLTVKRVKRAGLEQGLEVLPVVSREAAGALLHRFGDDALRAEFADYIRPLN
ncbi:MULTISPECIES: hypothetical protein [unclassified Nitrobacter]|uniref:hypothetical protein n=1 Tax=unclassified Nitrobacter TaxID=2620411 RepID=UPI00092C9E04|nr:MULTISPECIES: hypothetical protein [unclassified Nitrobacter]MBN9149163.1 hypothetical protein [Nitrobacter sp.]OJV00595.1 MAG: hypothetical protein BGO16_11000 [Nitrobacter sp. 62-23]